MTERAQQTYLGLDIGTSSVKALLVDADQRVVAEASAALERFAPASACGASRTRTIGSKGVEAAVAAIRAPGARGVRQARRHRPLRPDARRDAARRRMTSRCARRSCGTTAALSPNAPSSKRRVPDCRQPRRQSRDAGLHRAEDAVGRRPRAGRVRRDEARAAAQGLRPPAPVRRSGLGNVGRLGHAVARCRQARAGTSALLEATGLQLAAHAAAGRGLRGLGPSLARASPRAWGLAGRRSRSRAAAATTRPRRSASARSSPARVSFRSAPRASSSPSPTASSACRSARCTPSAMRCRTAGTACR